MAVGCEVGLGDDDGVTAYLRLQGNRIASTWHTHRLCVDGRGAILAGHTLRGLVEANWAANFAGVENSRDLAIWFLIEQESNFKPMFSCGKAMQVAVVDRLQRNGNLAIDEGDFRSRRQCARSLFVNKAGRDHHNEDKAASVDRDHPESLAPGRQQR